jgi:hypothetical protein
MPRRNRHGREFWTDLVDAYERSEEPEGQQDFAERHGVGCASFRRWLYRLREERGGKVLRRAPRGGKQKADGGGWPLVEVQGIPGLEPRLEVELANGRRVLVPASFDVEALRRLLAVVAEPVR